MIFLSVLRMYLAMRWMRNSSFVTLSRLSVSSILIAPKTGAKTRKDAKYSIPPSTKPVIGVVRGPNWSKRNTGRRDEREAPMIFRDEGQSIFISYMR